MTPLDSIPTVDFRDLASRDASIEARAIERLGRGLQAFGFFILDGHGIDGETVRASYAALREFFALPAAAKVRVSGVAGGARGYTALGVEHAKDHAQPDLKEFFQVGPDLPPGHALCSVYPENVWPVEVPALQEHLTRLFRALEETARRLLEAIALFHGVPRTTFEDMITDGNHVLRGIHYPPVANEIDSGAVRAAAHEDINLITLLFEATESGLELLSEGRWLPVEARPGQIVVDSGDMIARVTNGVIPATTHRVVNPLEDRNRSRYSMPFFVHPYPAADLSVLPSFLRDGESPRFDPITAGEFLDERLREIGLKG